jgi:hypothetical protein
MSNEEDERQWLQTQFDKLPEETKEGLELLAMDEFEGDVLEAFAEALRLELQKRQTLRARGLFPKPKKRVRRQRKGKATALPMPTAEKPKIKIPQIFRN